MEQHNRTPALTIEIENLDGEWTAVDLYYLGCGTAPEDAMRQAQALRSLEYCVRLVDQDGGVLAEWVDADDVADNDE